MLILYNRGPVDFSLLRQGLKMTPGNLDHHLRKLIIEGWVKEKKLFGFRNIKLFSLTDKGIKDFQDYAKIVHEILDEM